MRFFGVVVLFHPPLPFPSHLATYAPYLDKLLVVDNTQPSCEKQVEELLRQFHPMLEYVHLGTNRGVAAAFNLAAQRALKDGADWLLTMDQDSSFDDAALEKMKQYAGNCNLDEVGLLAPRHITATARQKIPMQPTAKLAFTMNSGCLVNLSAFQKVGGYNEQLFLDLVDHEYCLRLRARHYQLIQLNEVVLHHQLGTPITGFAGVRTVSHTSTRKYLMMRNRLYLMRHFGWEFPGYWFWSIRELVKDWLRVLLLEDHKTEKVKAMFRGIGHFATNRLGAPEEALSPNKRTADGD